jgi:heme-degrading monooxygenase HmoA
MYVAIWRFRIEEPFRDRFERAYGPDGDWARLFGRQSGFLGTELLLDEAGPDGDGGRFYLTIDRWRDRSDWLGFRAEHDAAYRALDRSCEALTAAEERIGAFATAC